MSKYTQGPLAVAVSDKWPFNIVTTDAAGNVVFSQTLPCHSTGHNNSAEAMSGKDMPPEWNAEERNARALADEVLRAAAPELLEACSRLLGSQTVSNPDPDNDPDVIFARAAIAKATGAENA